MDERPDQIIGHIEAQRDQLGRNLNELETRVRQSTDWRTYYDRNPMLMMGAALGGGLLLGSMVGSKSSDRTADYSRKWRSRSSSSVSSSALGLSSAGVGAAAGSSWSKPSGSSSSSSPSSSSSISSKGLVSSKEWNQVSETMEHIKAALIAFGMAKAKEFLGQAIPGIEQHLSEAEKKHQGQRQNHNPEHGSNEPAERFADSGAFAQGSGGSQATNWESDMYRSSGQFDNQGSASNPSSQSGTGDYYSKQHGDKQHGETTDAGQRNTPVPSHS